MKTEQMIDKALQLCREMGVSVLRYGDSFWLRADGVSLVRKELSGLSARDLIPKPIIAR